MAQIVQYSWPVFIHVVFIPFIKLLIYLRLILKSVYNLYYAIGKNSSSLVWVEPGRIICVIHKANITELRMH